MSQEEYEQAKQLFLENYGAMESHMGTEAYQAAITSMEAERMEHQEMAAYYKAKAGLNTTVSLLLTVIGLMSVVLFIPVTYWIVRTVFWG